MQNTEKFSFNTLTKEEFCSVYLVDGWMGRKVKAIPMAFWTGVIQSIDNIFRSFFAYTVALISSKENQATCKSEALKYFFSGVRDLQEGCAWILTLFNDFHGSYYLAEAKSQKEYYKNFG